MTSIKTMPILPDSEAPSKRICHALLTSEEKSRLQVWPIPASRLPHSGYSESALSSSLQRMLEYLDQDGLALQGLPPSADETERRRLLANEALKAQYPGLTDEEIEF